MTKETFAAISLLTIGGLQVLKAFLMLNSHIKDSNTRLKYSVLQVEEAYQQEIERSTEARDFDRVAKLNLELAIFREEQKKPWRIKRTRK